MPSLEHRVSALEQKVRQLSHDIDIYIAKDKELLARLRNGQSAWRAMQRTDDAYSLPSVGGHPFDEPSVARSVRHKPLPGTLQQSHPDGSAATDQAVVVLTERSVSDQNKAYDTDMTMHDTNSV